MTTAGLAVSKNVLLKDGKLFIPHGFCSVAGMYPAGGVYGHARLQFLTGTTLRQMIAWNCDVIEFKVIQKHLADPVHAPEYINGIKALVKQSEAAGMAVILCMQDSLPAPWGDSPDPNTAMPNDKTVAAWKVLAPAFAGDPYVAFELFNEAGILGNDVPSWQQWHTTYQALVDVVRPLAPNVVIAGGIHKAMSMEHFVISHPHHAPPTYPYALKGGNIVYAVHPYSFGKENWWGQWGAVTNYAPVMCSEWNSSSQELQDSGLVTKFLAYCEKYRAGMLGFPIDHTGDQVLVSISGVDPKHYDKPWTWAPKAPSGQALLDYFRTS